MLIIAHRMDPTATAQVVKQALEALDRPTALAANPLAGLPILTPEIAPADLRGLLVDVIVELGDSAVHRDAEAGRLLFDYYVKRAGAHEVVMQRLHMSRPTYYRRLQHGYALIACQLNRLNEFALWFQRRPHPKTGAVTPNPIKEDFPWS